MPTAPKYANWWSRLILAGQFERQFMVPSAPKPAVREMMRLVERVVLRPRLSDIAVRQPIFLVGLHRSGTTMVQDLLCSLPEVAYITNVMNVYPDALCGAEFVRRALRIDVTGERYLADGVIVNGGSPNEGVALWQRWLREDPYDCHYVERRASDLGDAQIARISDDLRRVLWCFRPYATRLFNKNPCLTPHVLLLAGLFPEAKFLHVVRDPRDCAPSMGKLYRLTQQQLAHIRATGGHGLYDQHDFMPFPRLPRLAEYVAAFGPDDLRTTASLWRDGVNWLHAARDRLPAYLEVRYEDIVADPQPMLCRILEFCELPMPQENAAFTRKLAEVGRTAKPRAAGDAELIEDICGEAMQRLGYECRMPTLAT